MNYKRFIAGAKCPLCHKIDKIYLVKLPNLQQIECNSCGFKQTQPFQNSTGKSQEEK